jgi:hypothetical protein
MNKVPEQSLFQKALERFGAKRQKTLGGEASSYFD